VLIRLEDIPRAGQTVRLGAPTSHDGTVVGTALEGEVRQLDGTLKVERSGSGVAVTVKAHALAVRPCDRCGAPVDLVVDVDERLAYEPQDDRLAHKEIELKDDDLDVGFLSGDGIETDDVLSEAFALAAPVRVTCADDACAELAKLREEPAADDVVGHPAFQALKKLL
jgi:uncharacterized metal-binding protein YceD (DUF177 family)